MSTKIPDIDIDPLGYASYIVKDLRELVETASPDKQAITLRLDLIDSALTKMTNGFFGSDTPEPKPQE